MKFCWKAVSDPSVTHVATVATSMRRDRVGLTRRRVTYVTDAVRLSGSLTTRSSRRQQLVERCTWRGCGGTALSGRQPARRLGGRRVALVPVRDWMVVGSGCALVSTVSPRIGKTSSSFTGSSNDRGKGCTLRMTGSFV